MRGRQTGRHTHTHAYTHLVTAARRWCWVTGRLVRAGAEQFQPRAVPAAPARTKSARRPPPPPRCLGSARLGPAGRAAGGRCVGAPGRIHRPPDFPECRHDVCSTHAPQSSGRPSRRARGDLCRVRRRSTPNADPPGPERARQPEILSAGTLPKRASQLAANEPSSGPPPDQSEATAPTPAIKTAARRRRWFSNVGRRPVRYAVRRAPKRAISVAIALRNTCLAQRGAAPGLPRR